LVGSLHPPELKVYLDLFKRFKPDFQDLKLILAPRHFHWKKDLITHVEATGYSYFLWNEQTSVLNNTHDMLGTLEEYVFDKHDILLVCTIGKLFNLYCLIL